VIVKVRPVDIISFKKRQKCLFSEWAYMISSLLDYFLIIQSIDRLADSHPPARRNTHSFSQRLWFVELIDRFWNIEPHICMSTATQTFVTKSPLNRRDENTSVQATFLPRCDTRCDVGGSILRRIFDKNCVAIVWYYCAIYAT
jgi:hypothetical protein